MLMPLLYVIVMICLRLFVDGYCGSPLVSDYVIIADQCERGQIEGVTKGDEIQGWC